MKLSRLISVDPMALNWLDYDLIFLASGFEKRSTHIFEKLPGEAIKKCVVLGFENDRNKLSRLENDSIFNERGVSPFLAYGAPDYENKIRETLLAVANIAKSRPLNIFVDYSVMTRAWYGYILTWLNYTADAAFANVDFAYSHGKYHSEFDPLHIEELCAIQGFEGQCTGARRTFAFYGLGYDRYATLAVNELIEPDNVICFVARESETDPTSDHVIQQNSEIIAISGSGPVYLPLANIQEAFRILHEQFSEIPDGDEIIAVPMGPKTHVLATMLVAQFLPRVTCLHARGARRNPVQVTATGEVSIWRAEYR